MFAPDRLPLATRAAIVLRLLTVQGSYNYETMIGNGIAFAMEPALRMLPGGRKGTAYRDAMARQSRYFNAHPYLAAVAVGALARAELALDDPARIERFRTACCGPMGSIGDRLVWAAWLPLCSLVGLVAFGLGASPLVVVLTFLGVYNAGHLGLRVWGLHAGWQRGLDVAPALGGRLFRDGPRFLTRAMAITAGLAVPLAIARAGGLVPLGVGAVAAVGAAGAVVLVLMQGRLVGWKAALALLAAAALGALAVR